MNEIVRFYDDDDLRIYDVAAAHDIAHTVKPDIGRLSGIFDESRTLAIRDVALTIDDSDIDLQDYVDEVRKKISDTLGREVLNDEFREIFTTLTQLELFAEDYGYQRDMIDWKLEKAIQQRYVQWQEENAESLLVRRLAREVDQYEYDDDSE